MSIHKSLSLGSGLSTSRSVFTRRERIEKLMEKGSFEEGGSVYGLPKVRTKYKVLSKKQLKAIASEQRIKDAEIAAAEAAAASQEEEAI
jgi:small basic protein (TIGR04137 family)